ncbi:acyltransferase family protein [Levilactobacillus parabrevis]|uniref:acyltransferase family protein n=1 Tax=Levilactobacillus parabrevis TaxID=357278 RepID=UPI003757C725
MKNEELHAVADGGDYLKVFACTAVILQSVLGFALGLTQPVALQRGLAWAYLLVKFTAPAFICGILLTTMRTTARQQPIYRHYLKQQWSALFFPTICWTLAYLLIFPGLQQQRAYHDGLSFVWQFVNGNAAPHLWYNTMMLQMIFLMPLFWVIRRLIHSRWAAWWALGLTAIGYLAWMAWYTLRVYPTAQFTDWYLLDRVFLGFFPYAILGILAWVGWSAVQRQLRRWWWLLLVIGVVALVGQNRALLSWPLPVSFSHTSYYLPATVIYILSIIGLILALAGHQQSRHSRWLPVIHRLAGYAYPSYLANVFWLQLIWLLGGAAFTRQHALLGIASCYLLTWCWSFGFTALLDNALKWRKTRWQERNR